MKRYEEFVLKTVNKRIIPMHHEDFVKTVTKPNNKIKTIEGHEHLIEW